MNIKRIKEFIRRQRLIGEHQFAQKILKRYNKSAEEFYKKYADNVYYEKDGQKVGLDIQTLWYFRTNDLIKSELLDALENMIKLTEYHKKGHESDIFNNALELVKKIKL